MLRERFYEVHGNIRFATSIVSSLNDMPPQYPAFPLFKDERRNQRSWRLNLDGAKFDSVKPFSAISLGAV